MDATNNQTIIGYFIEEAQEHLETIEKGILELSSAVHDQETINELFRAAHSVKGGAAMLNFTSIQTSAHRLEDAFKILRDKPLEVDQTLESLFLKSYDTLHNLVERLQGPEGLPKEEGDKIMAEAEPHFQELLDYLHQLTGEKPASKDYVVSESQPEVLTPSSTSESISSEDLVIKIKAVLREMLSIFKQQATPENRQQLQNLCDDLSKLAIHENGWQQLIQLSKKAIANPKHSYQILAPVIIKEIKLAGDYLALKKGTEVTPSLALQQLAEARFPFILLSLEPEIAASTLTKVFNREQLSQLVQILQTAS